MFTQIHACFAPPARALNQSHKDDCFFEFTSCRRWRAKTNLLNTPDVLKLATIEGARANALLHRPAH